MGELVRKGDEARSDVEDGGVGDGERGRAPKQEAEFAAIARPILDLGFWILGIVHRWIVQNMGWKRHATFSVQWILWFRWHGFNVEDLISKIVLQR